MRNRLWLPIALIVAVHLTACGDDDNNNVILPGKVINFDSLGDSESFRLGSVEFVVTEVASNEVNISVKNQDQSDQMNITISDSVSGVVLFEFLFVPPGIAQSSGNFAVLSGVQLHLEVLNVGTNFNPPQNCSATTPVVNNNVNNNTNSCFKAMDLSITF